MLPLSLLIHRFLPLISITDLKSWQIFDRVNMVYLRGLATMYITTVAVISISTCLNFQNYAEIYGGKKITLTF